MKTTFLLLAALSALAFAPTRADLAPIDLSGISPGLAIAGTTGAGNPSAYKNRGAFRAFDGSGIAADGTCPTAADDAMFMLSSNNSGSFPWYIQVDLGSVRRLDAVRLYNFNFAKNGNAYTVRGPRNFRLYVSTTPVWKTSAEAIEANYRLALESLLPQASGTDDYAGTYFELDEPVNARFVALVALDDWDDTVANLNYNGISEIRLFSGGDPLDEPGAGQDEGVSVIVDNSDADGVEISGAWTASAYNDERWGPNYLHNGRNASEDLWVRYTPNLPSNGLYRVSLFWNGDDTRNPAVPVEIVHRNGVTTNYVDMTVPSDTWNEIGAWNFAAGTSGSVRIMTIGIEGDYAIADAVKFELAREGLAFFVR